MEKETVPHNTITDAASDMTPFGWLIKGTNGRQKTYVKKLKILYSSDHPILIKFRQLVVNIVIKELQMVFLTSTVINSNRNMKELERKIKCEKLMFR